MKKREIYTNYKRLNEPIEQMQSQIFLEKFWQKNIGWLTIFFGGGDVFFLPLLS